MWNSSDGSYRDRKPDCVGAVFLVGTTAPQQGWLATSEPVTQKTIGLTSLVRLRDRGSDSGDSHYI